jgi:hypothetical protein
MLDFHKYLMRFGEHGVQAILENIERVEGIRYTSPVSLEDRWTKVMQDKDYLESVLAA